MKTRTLRANFIALLCSVTTMMFLNSCYSLRDHFVSPGRIDRDGLADGIDRLQDICHEISGCPEELEIIGHGAGSYRYYPMKITKKDQVLGNGWEKKNRDSVKNVKEMIDISFASGLVKAVEIDVQIAPEDHFLDSSEPADNIFILHDIPKKWPKSVKPEDETVIAYLKSNTLRQTLAHFIEKKYYLDKHLYIELKAKRQCMSPDADTEECTRLGKAVAAEIANQLARISINQNPEGNWLSVISFSAGALKATHEALNANQRKQVSFVLIAGAQHLGLWVFGQGKGDVPMFSTKFRNFTSTTSWLDKIWFSPQGMPKFRKKFGEVADIRTTQLPDTPPLEFSTSTYQHKYKKFYKKMTKADFTLPMPSMMIDIEDPRSF